MYVPEEETITVFGTSRIKHFQEQVETNGFDQTAHYQLALEYLKAGRYLEAAAKFRRAVELNPEYVDAWAGLGDAYLQAGISKETLAAWRTGAGVARRIGLSTAAEELDRRIAELASRSAA